MQALDLIKKKRDGRSLTAEEIDFLVEGYVAEEIPDYQMAAFLMAVFFNSMNSRETVQLTSSMADSGEKLDLSGLEGFKADKHSTGGVGDSTSLVVVPLAAACGLKMAKLSGRALGHTGGTIDKLESIPGFRVAMDGEDFLRFVKRTGAAIMEHTRELAPADRKIYHLRDRTATVESLPLITSSIMSKKLACGPDGVVLDVKVGSGAFIKERERAGELARGCLQIGRASGLRVSAVLTDMDHPLGRAVGNALEVREAIEVLKGETRGELAHLAVVLVSELLLAAGKAGRKSEAMELARARLKDGSAAAKFEEMVENQGGECGLVDNPDRLPRAECRAEVLAEKGGYIGAVSPLPVAQVANALGAGRSEKGEGIDHSAGLELLRKRGERVEKGEAIARLHFNDEKRATDELEDILKGAFSIQEEKPSPKKLIFKRLRSWS